MDFALTIELGKEKSEVTNYEDVKQQIVSKLEFIREQCPVYEALTTRKKTTARGV